MYLFLFLKSERLVWHNVLNELVGQETRATQTGLYIFKKSYIIIKIEEVHYILICYILECIHDIFMIQS